MKFYATFGTSTNHPFQGGWVVIEADKYEDAYEAFAKVHGYNKNGLLRCCSIYPESVFKTTSMYSEGNLGAYEHASISKDGKILSIKL